MQIPLGSFSGGAELAKQRAYCSSFYVGLLLAGKVEYHCDRYEIIVQGVLLDIDTSQIFLTKSTFLAERLQVYLAKLIASQLGDPSTQPRSDVRGCADPEYILMESKDPLEDQTFDMKDFKFPLVCTFNQFYSFLEKLIQ